ncbi:uncharacterized protein L3040_007303 [Drepanopeziza brunnea f. sp. 'multigermtubi']|uniref:Integral membrane protein n=1 Tax=Marssonina brunnea f. sp. multigermtubi (strain MB_m1) TaxID=1072389 RepID=K1WRJ7_MARBU|nr:uncharacterized protein MBM_00977 [Drepanopeziza brunnea f. sp. 'multigermtubi' MB_m1]EKD20295.1 integral membrane protein [Drepanopeziza brunnea f. sp. 'multigermtubi' MB_m1]KAJ5038442.1 hypothetical protein L3040_007303 [Drepanopeziza brunnea f. sp. 'multigermtubi']
MHLLRAICLLPLLVEVLVAANADIVAILQELPQCAVKCIAQRVEMNITILPDPTVTCRNETLQVTIASCVLGTCDFEEQQQVILLNKLLCKGIAPESRAWQIAIVGLVCGSVALIAVSLRCYCRHAINRRLGFDDWLAVGAGALLISYTTLQIYNGLVNGYGRHFWDVDQSKMVELLKIFWIAEIIFISALAFVKSSILVFYLRVFTPRWFCILDIITLIAVVLSWLGTTFATIFQCSPMTAIWDRAVPSKCIDVNSLSYATGSISVVLNLIILILPIPLLFRLRMGLKKKLSLLLMFGLGSLACITSGIRLKYLIAFATSKDPSYLPLTGDNAVPAIWSFVELCVALICACLPAMRALLSRWFPSIFDLTAPPSTNIKPISSSASKIPFEISTESGLDLKFIEKAPPSYYTKGAAIVSDENFLFHTPSSEVLPNRLSSHFQAQLPMQGRRGSGIWPRRFPPVFSQLSQPFSHARSGSSDTIPAHLARPSTPQLSTARHSGADSQVRMWNSPTCDHEGNSDEVVEVDSRRVPSPRIASDYRVSIAESETSVWALEGPRLSDQFYGGAIDIEGWLDRNVHTARRASISEDDSPRHSQQLQFAEEGMVMRPVSVSLPTKQRGGRVFAKRTSASSGPELLPPVPQGLGSCDDLNRF